MRIFKKRKSKPQPELAGQLTAYERRALEHPGVSPPGLPYRIYDQMEQDPMVQTVLTVKKLGVLAAPWRVVPAAGEEGARIADFVLDAFHRMDGSPHTILMGAMDAFAKGLSIQEMIWQSDGRHIRLVAVKPKDPSLFGLDVDRFGNLKGLKLHLPGEQPEPLPADKFLIYANRSSYGRPKGKSDLDAAYTHWQAKVSLQAAWRLHLECFAMPTVMGKFSRGLPSEEHTAMLAALQDLHRATAIMHPSDIDVSLIGGGKEASAGFMEALDFHNREIARAVLGQTLATDEGRRVGSLAMGRVHLQVLILQLEALRRELADVVMTEQVIRPLVEMNFGPVPIPRFEFEPTMLSAFTTGSM